MAAEPGKVVSLSVDNTPADGSPGGSGTGAASVRNMAMGGAMQMVAGAKAIFGRLQPAAEFAQFSKPENDIAHRAKSNLVHYQANYIALFVVAAVIAFATHPVSLILVLLLIVGWMFFLKKNSDPEWQVVVAGMSLGPTRRTLAVTAVTIIVLFFFVGNALFPALIICSILVAAHSVLHPVTYDVLADEQLPALVPSWSSVFAEGSPAAAGANAEPQGYQGPMYTGP
eukprot:TRINITY_DN71755_c0_g1_i1.p1 TRINITY_DN71755_c0_g1~~TRINITY_DN71755_c0_g1_i1.p1  ORF type:complete len:251 (-),score=41.21 TRINITY_DN71755_c0_g1_i1:101-781(-)